MKRMENSLVRNGGEESLLWAARNLEKFRLILASLVPLIGGEAANLSGWELRLGSSCAW